ncbi:MAG: hypothetical protein Q7U97_15895, partial [Rhodocyclaceae bacterium]|nr:hypothetical protein [Rhodocyclaceae bacterium]
PDGTVKFMGVNTVLNKDDPVSRAKRTIGHLVHHFRAIEKLPLHMELWEQCQAIMLNDDKPFAEDYSAKGEVCPDDALPSFKFYQARQVEMDQGAETSWPGVRSLFWLMRQRAKNAKAFGTEMQGDPRSDEDKVFDPVHFFISRLPQWIMFGGCDPSMGNGEKSHPSALIAGAWDRERGKLHVIDARIKRRVPSKLEADLIDFQREHRCQAIGFESNNAYEHSRQTFRAAGILKGVPLPLVALPESVEREVRIDGMEPFITDALDPRILFSPELTQLLAELDSWPEKQTHHDYDGLCALYILWKIANMRGGGAAPNVASRPRSARGSTAKGY